MAYVYDLDIAVEFSTHHILQYLPRSGIATPAQIINAVQEGTLNSILVSVAL